MNLTLDELEKTIKALQPKEPVFTFDALLVNDKTKRDWRDKIQEMASAPEKTEYSLGDIRVIPQEYMPDNMVAMTSGGHLVGIWDLNKGTVTTISKPMFPRLGLR